MELKRVVVTGIGALSPVGNTAPETWEALKAGKRIQIYRPPEGSCWSDIGSFGQYFEANEKLLTGKAMKETAPDSPFVFGKNCKIASDVKLSGFVSIGDNVRVPSGTELRLERPLDRLKLFETLQDDMGRQGVFRILEV